MKKIVLAFLLISVAMIGVSFVSANHDINHINMDRPTLGDSSNADALVHINYKSIHEKSGSTDSSNPDGDGIINYIFPSGADYQAYAP